MRWSRSERWGSERRGLRLTAIGGARSAGVVLAPLVPVQRAVGPVEQAGHGAQGARPVRREAEADRELIGSCRAAVQVAHPSLQPLGEHVGAFGPRVAHQHSVFVAANPGHQVRVAERLPQKGGGVAQRAIANRMAGGVVHALQVVQVGECHEQRFITAAGETEIPGRERQEAPPVVQARQIVDEGKVQKRGVEPVPLDREPEGVREDRTVDVTLHEEVLRPGAHGFEAVALVLGVREKEERYRRRQRTELREGREAAPGGERHGEKHDVDAAPRQPAERLLRCRGCDVESVEIGAGQEVSHTPCFLLLIAHHQHDELVAARLHLAPAGGLAPIDGPTSLGLVAPLVVERDDFQTALAQATLAVITAGREEPPVDPMVLACDHARVFLAGAWKMGGEPPATQSTLPRRTPRWREIVIAESARGPRAACDARAPSRRRADSEPMTTQRKNRRKKADRRSGADRRTEQAPPEVERRTGGQRRTGLERRLELETAGDQIQAALGLLTFAVEQGVFLDEDRWLLETAITRLRLAVEQLGEGTDDSP